PACYITQARKGEITLQELGQRITAAYGSNTLPQFLQSDLSFSGLLHHAGKKRRDHSAGTGATYYCR
ncbi:hypothetical protein PS027_23850, partial [Shigella sonnei]|nr:hypothetical protein [Shigella sonnei]